MAKKSLEKSFKEGYGDIAKKNPRSKSSNDSRYGDPKGGHEIKDVK